MVNGGIWLAQTKKKTSMAVWSGYRVIVYFLMLGSERMQPSLGLMAVQKPQLDIYLIISSTCYLCLFHHSEIHSNLFHTYGFSKYKGQPTGTCLWQALAQVRLSCMMYSSCLPRVGCRQCGLVVYDQVIKKFPFFPCPLSCRSNIFVVVWSPWLSVSVYHSYHIGWQPVGDRPKMRMPPYQEVPYTGTVFSMYIVTCHIQICICDHAFHCYYVL